MLQNSTILLTLIPPDFIMLGGYASSGGHVRVVNSVDDEIDRLGWGSAVAPETTVLPAAAEIGSIDSAMFRTDITKDTDNNANDFAFGSVNSSIVKRAV